MPINTPGTGAPTQRLSPDFWKFWTGQAISALGNSFTGFARPLIVFKLTGSAVNLAISVAAGILPHLLFGLIIGAWTDRVDRKRLMILMDLGRAAPAIQPHLASDEQTRELEEAEEEAAVPS